MALPIVSEHAIKVLVNRMKSRSNPGASWRSALVGAVLGVLLGVALLGLGFGERLALLGYDLVFLFRSPPQFQNLEIIYMDDQSFAELGQRSAANWDRNLHAQLVDRLTADGARLVVFDIVFSEPGVAAANTNFARAIQRNGKVVLAASLDYQSRPQIKVKGPVRSLPEFEAVAAGWGIAEVMSGPGRVARQYYSGGDSGPSLPWAAATVAGAEITKSKPGDWPELWLNFYGRALALPFLSYREVTNQPAGFFRDKYVFVGARPKTLKAQDEADEFRTPHTWWTGEFSPGVEVTATAFLNLVRQDGLRRLSWRRELWLIIAAGLLFGGVLTLVRPMWAGGFALAGVAGMVVAAVQAAQQHGWFGWTVVAFAQIPGALAWAWWRHFHRLKFEKEVLERTLAETTRLTPVAAAKPALAISDHTLVRRVGKGAYGEVWLARNTIGVFHAVKIVQRREFSSDAPYEREFKGIQKFMPISRSHPGFVNVLHVGRDDVEGFFFYIMEAGDDVQTGQQIDADSYSPKTLATELTARGMLPPEECRQLGLALALALEHLHRQQLVHRDIKPANIIYVHGAPKFADIGLVTEVGTAARDVSNVGTEGYVAPEGPGTAAADVYALGKVLYEACMGRDRRLFPEVPTTVLEQPDDSLLRRLNEIICRACESDATERYQSARELHEALAGL